MQSMMLVETVRRDQSYRTRKMVSHFELMSRSLRLMSPETKHASTPHTFDSILAMMREPRGAETTLMAWAAAGILGVLPLALHLQLHMHSHLYPPRQASSLPVRAGFQSAERAALCPTAMRGLPSRRGSVAYAEGQPRVPSRKRGQRGRRQRRQLGRGRRSSGHTQPAARPAVLEGELPELPSSCIARPTRTRRHLRCKTQGNARATR